MKCCNQNCTQGRNCPMRQKISERFQSRARSALKDMAEKRDVMMMEDIDKRHKSMARDILNDHQDNMIEALVTSSEIYARCLIKGMIVVGVLSVCAGILVHFLRA